MRAHVIDAFVEAASQVLESELGLEPRRGPIASQGSAYTSDEVTAVVAVTGDISGMVLITLTEATARAIVATMLGHRVSEFDGLAQSGIAELCNVLTGRAAVLLSDTGLSSVLAPPMLLMGRGTTISTLDVQRLVIPLDTDLGKIELQVALKLNSGRRRRVA